MNPHILMAIDNQMNPDKYTLDELKAAAAYAYSAYAACHASYAYADYEGWYSSRNAAAAAYTAAYGTTVKVTYWLNEYFNYTGENKQDYIDAINKLTTK